MTAPQRPELQRARQWSVALAAALDEITGQVGYVARRLSHCWPDEHGRQWAERLLLLRRALERDAEAAAELGRSVDRVTDAVAAAPDDAGDRYPSAHTGATGPRLGDTAARRAEDERGVRIPRLGDPEDDAG
jgi:hypothetical protein